MMRMTKAQAEQHAGKAKVREALLAPQDARIATIGGRHDIPLISDDWCLRLTLSYPPSSNMLYAQAGNRRVLTAQGKAWKKEQDLSIRAQLTQRVWLEYQRTDLADRLFTLSLWLHHHDHRVNPKTGKLKQHDADNRVKIVQDVMREAGLYRDDTQVFGLHVRKRWCAAHITPWVEMELRLWNTG